MPTFILLLLLALTSYSTHAATSSSIAGRIVTIKQNTQFERSETNKKSYLTIPHTWQGYVLQGVGNVLIEESQLVQIPAFPLPSLNPTWSIAEIENATNEHIRTVSPKWKQGVQVFLDKYRYDIAIADIEIHLTHAGKKKTLAWNLLVQANGSVEWNPPKLLDDDQKPKQLYIRYLPSQSLPDVPPTGDLIYNNPAAGQLQVEERDEQFNLIKTLGSIAIGDLNDRPQPEESSATRALNAGFLCLIDRSKAGCSVPTDLRKILAENHATRAVFDYSRIALPGNKATERYEADIQYNLQQRKTRVNLCTDEAEYSQEAQYTINRMERITERILVYPNGKFHLVNRFNEAWQIPQHRNQSSLEGNLFQIKAPQCASDDGFLLPRVAHGFPQPKNRLTYLTDGLLPSSALTLSEAEFDPYVPEGYYKVPGKKACCPIPSRWDDGAGQCICDTVDQFGRIVSSSNMSSLGTGGADRPYACGGNDGKIAPSSGVCATVCVPQTCSSHETFNEATCQCEAMPICAPVGTAPTGSSWNTDRCAWVCADGTNAPASGCAPPPESCRPSGTAPSGAHWDTSSCAWYCSDGTAASSGGCLTTPTCGPTGAPPAGSFWSDGRCAWVCLDGNTAPTTGCDSSPGACPAHSCPSPYKPVAGSHDRCQKVEACSPGFIGKGTTFEMLYDSRSGMCGYGRPFEASKDCGPLVCPTGQHGPYGPERDTCCKANEHWNGTVCEADGPELLATLAGCSYSGSPGIEAITVKPGVAQTARWCGGQHYVRFVWDGHSFTVTDTGLDCHTCPIKGTQYEIEVWLN